MLILTMPNGERRFIKPEDQMGTERKAERVLEEAREVIEGRGKHEQPMPCSDTPPTRMEK